MPTELGAITIFKIYHTITNKANREVQYINYTYIEIRFLSHFVLIIILITEKLFVKLKFVCVVCKETGCHVVIFEIKIALTCIIIYKKYNIDQIYKY